MIVFRKRNNPGMLSFGRVHPTTEATPSESGGDVEYDYSTVGGIRDAWIAGVIDDNTAIADLVEIGNSEAVARSYISQWKSENIRKRVGITYTAVPLEEIDIEEEGTPIVRKDAVVVPAGSNMLTSETSYDTPDAAKNYACNIWATEYITESLQDLPHPGYQVTECGGTPSNKEPGKYVGYLIVRPGEKAPEEEKTSYWPWIAGGIGLLALGGIMIYATSGKKK